MSKILYCSTCQKEVLYCPTCQKEVHFHLDEWGRTSWHLHCENCNINIGMNSLKKAEELLSKYHTPILGLNIMEMQFKFLM